MATYMTAPQTVQTLGRSETNTHRLFSMKLLSVETRQWTTFDPGSPVQHDSVTRSRRRAGRVRSVRPRWGTHVRQDLRSPARRADQVARSRCSRQETPAAVSAVVLD